jgi:hypothetical protein
VFGGVYWGLSTGQAGGSAALCWGHASRHSSSKHNRACAGEEGHVEIPWAMCYYGHNTTEHPGERGERRCGGGAVRAGRWRGGKEAGRHARPDGRAGGQEGTAGQAGRQHAEGSVLG